MPFSDLFTELPGVEEEPRHRNGTNLGQGSSQKRKPQKQLGSYSKRQCLRSHAARPVDPEEEPTASDAHRRPRPSGSSARSHNQEYRTSRSNDYNKGNTNYKNYHKKKNKGKKKKEREQRYQNERYKRARDTHFTQPQKRFMTQEFKDKHALEVDGRLICKYYVLGRCSKGEECQLEHVEPYNDLIKEVCKFYIQESCSKGTACPYMHKSIPCKFFHIKSGCSSFECRFSHDPLTDVTQKVLDAIVQWENAFIELKRAAEEPVSQTAMEEQNPKEGIIIPNVRFGFFQSSETAVEAEALLPQNELQCDIIEEDSAPQTENDVESADSLPSATLDQAETVCYSVEAVLGPQLSKPVLYTATQSQRSAPHLPKATTERFADPVNAPYSVANVLRSENAGYKSHLYTPPVAQPAVASCELGERETRAVDDKCEVSHLDNIKHQNEQQKIFKQPLSAQVAAASGQNDNKAPNGTKIHHEVNDTKGGTTTAPNLTLVTDQINADSKRRHLPQICSSVYQKYQLPEELNMIKVGQCGQDPKRSEDVTTSSLNDNKSVNTSLSTKQVTIIQQNRREPTRETSMNVQSSHATQNVAENRQDRPLGSSIPPPRGKTTSRFGHLFANLNSDTDQTSSTSSWSSDTLQTANAKKVFKSASRKVRQTTKQSHFAESATKATNNVSYENQEAGLLAERTETLHGNFHKPVSLSATPNSKGESKKEDTEGAKTPAKSFQSLFSSLPAVVDTFSDKPAVSSAKKLKKPNCNSQKALQATKSSQLAENTLEIENKSEHSNDGEVGFVTETSNNSSQNPVSSHATRNFKGENKNDCKTFQSLFTNLPNWEEISSVGESFHGKPAVSSAQSVENSKRADFGFNQALKTKQFLRSETDNADNDNSKGVGLVAAAEISNHSSQNPVSSFATYDSKGKNQNDYTQSAKTPVKPFQSLFANLPKSDEISSVCESFNGKPVVSSAQNTENSKRADCDFNQATKTGPFEIESADNDNAKGVGSEAAAETSSNSLQKSVSLSATPYSKKEQDTDIEMPNTPVQSPQSLFAESTTKDYPVELPQLLLQSKSSKSPSSETTVSVNKTTEESKSEHIKDAAATCSSNTSDKTTASPQHQSHAGPLKSVLKTLFLQLPPYEEIERHHD